MALQMIYYHGKELFCPKYDRVFKALLLGNDKDYTFLASFLTGVLAKEIHPENIISASSTELPALHGNDKIVRLDIRVRFMDGTIVNIEMQVGKDFSMGPRSLHQISRLLTGSVGKGQKNEEICPVIAINVLDFDYITDGDGYHNRYRMKNMVTGAEMPGAHILEVHFVELTKFFESASKGLEELWSRLLTAQKEENLDMLTQESPVTASAERKFKGVEELWLRFLTAKTEEDLDMLAQESPIMASLVDKLVYVSGTKELRDQMDDYKVNEMKNRLSLMYAKKEGVEKGIAEGREEGEKRRAIAIARKMKDKGKSVNEIIELTDLTVDDVLRL